jgi:predicted ATPase
MTSGRRTVLITGNPGSGTTAMVAELIRLGHDFLLSIDAATQIERLTTAGEREPALWQPIIDGRPVFEDEMQTVGATVLDGRRATSDLATEIVRLLRAP